MILGGYISEYKMCQIILYCVNKYVMEKLYTISEFAVLINKKVKTLQKWDRDGVLTAYRTPTNRRYYTHTQYLEYIGHSSNKTEENKKINVIYARVSTRNQKDDLINQIHYLENVCLKNGIQVSNIYSDFGSGLNYKRKNWSRLIEDCFEGKIDTIIVSHKDRFIRFGFDWIVEILERYYSVKVEVVENIATTPEQEMINDLISIIHVFSCRVYGLRKYKKKIEKDLDI